MSIKKGSIIFLALLIFIGGCAAPTPKLRMKPQDSPDIKYCVDTIGHIPGRAPWILGGTCCCTPTEEMFDIYKEEGTVPNNMSYEDFIDLFEAKDIVTDLNPEYVGSNNRDDHGPHVVFGGKSMVTPTPGTDNYEEVISGKRH